MNEDKMFEFMTKMYSEMQEGFKDIKTEGKVHTERFNKLENKLDTIEIEVKKIGARIDGKLIPTNEALLDGYKNNSEHITIIDDKIDRLQIDVNTITMKVSYNDSRIIEISKDIKKAK